MFCMCVCVVLRWILYRHLSYLNFCNHYYFSYFYTELYFTGHTVYRNLNRKVAASEELPRSEEVP